MRVYTGYNQILFIRSTPSPVPQSETGLFCQYCKVFIHPIVYDLNFVGPLEFNLGSYHFLPGGGGASVCGGGPEFFGVVKGGDQNFFSGSKGGPKFFYVCKGGDQKKLATGHHRQTAPPPGKNDSSLSCTHVRPTKTFL